MLIITFALLNIVFLQITPNLVVFFMKTDVFALRHLGPREEDLNHMLQTIGVTSFDQLIYETIPDDIKLKKPLQLEAAMSEYEYLNHILN